MTNHKREKLKQAENWCNAGDRSTEFMMQYMQDYADATFDEVMEYLCNKPRPSAGEEREREL